MILGDNDGLGDIAARIYNLPLYKALAFTITYCILVTPLAMVLEVWQSVAPAGASGQSAGNSADASASACRRCVVISSPVSVAAVASRTALGEQPQERRTTSSVGTRVMSGTGSPRISAIATSLGLP